MSLSKIVPPVIITKDSKSLITMTHYAHLVSLGLLETQTKWLKVNPAPPVPLSESKRDIY